MDRYLSGLDKGQAQVVPPPRGLREVTSEVVDALAAVHSEVLVAAPSQVCRARHFAFPRGDCCHV